MKASRQITYLSNLYTVEMVEVLRKNLVREGFDNILIGTGNLSSGGYIDVIFKVNEDAFYERTHKICIGAFPGNCSWLILYHIHNIPEEFIPVVIDVANEIAEFLRYARIYLSVNSDMKKYWSPYLDSNNYKLLDNNINYHSNNRVFLYSKEIDKQPYEPY